MHGLKRWLTLAAVAGLSALLLAAVACGDDGDDGDVIQPTATGEAHMDDDGDEHAGDEGVIHIEEREWEISSLDGGEIPAATAGEVTFEIHNEGESQHTFLVIQTDADPAELPVSGSTVDVDAAGALAGEADLIDAGAIEVLTAHLDAGTYALICNIDGHYEQGMHAQLTVE